MDKKIRSHLENDVKDFLIYKKVQIRNKKIASMAQGKAPIQFALLKAKYFLLSIFSVYSIQVTVIASITFGVIYYYKSSLNKIESKNLRTFETDEFKREYKQTLKTFNFNKPVNKNNEVLSIGDTTIKNTSIFKLNHWDGDFVKNYFDSDTIFIGDFIDTNLVLIFLKSNVKELKIDGFEYNIDPIDTLYSNNNFKIYKQTEVPFLLKEERYPSSTKLDGTPSFIKNYLLYRKDYYIFVTVFNPNNSEGYMQIETNNGYFIRKKFAKTSNIIIDAVKIKISEIDSSFSIRGFMKNERSELHLSSGTTWGAWIKIYE